MSSNTRPVVLDDTDPSIQYTGQGWFQDSGSQDGQGNFGGSYLRTRHGTKSNDSLALSFKGPSLVITYRVRLASAWNVIIRNIRPTLGNDCPLSNFDREWYRQWPDVGSEMGVLRRRRQLRVHQTVSVHRKQLAALSRDPALRR